MKLLQGVLLLFTGLLAFERLSPAQAPSSGIDLNALDKSVNPCTNFYQYACGTWIKNHPVPSDQSRWTRFQELADHNDEIERKILEAAAASGRTRTANEQKIGDYYASCMDEAAIERKGVSPLKPLLDEIAALNNRDRLTAEIVRLHHL